ncbi:MAG: Cell envelope-associated transcriptional attenuator LytR-CpsA-Psr, subfamily A1 (as in PMID19099556) [uncultured Corynebacteriales bacterium]|uniref:Cell envelope-associated transcriptional attenuator LytR-CpsA-Psr, subfamily A1 (As in PMID19099556) n=1 Tax=uncultured Mycobacteriales bacterium TaxID=581187 RepID=A0A6J4HCK8_9ACTN|nr:MAG: Cell envelope-associated transcriptional attenuator LytR-CpsA-Psr, subfamily A1 (as in PMID19099556) [uncultured Corynebacteriales bacterium]
MPLPRRPLDADAPPPAASPDGTADEEPTWQPVEPARRRRPRTRTVLLAALAVLVLLVVAGAVGVELASRRVLGKVERIPEVFAPLDEAKRPQKPAGTDKTLNVLLVGVDTGTAGARDSDAIMLMHVAADRRTAAFVSIPRDSWVAVPDRGPDTIASAYATGGPTLLVRTVEQLTALRIDHFAVMDFAGFKDITDDVGGVDVRVRRASAGFPAGPAHFDGDAALRYVRQQSRGPGGDLEHARRQQQVMKALLTRMGEVGLQANPARTLGLLESVARTTRVDDSLGDGKMRSLALSLRNLRPEQVDFLTAPTGPPGRAGEPRVRLDPVRATGLWDAMVRDDVPGYLRGHPELRPGPL